MTIKKRGFTLIELLVVISIIGLLSSVVLASLQTSRTRAVNAKKNVMVKEYIKAIELYNDANGTYPYKTSGVLWDANGFSCLGVNNANTSGTRCFYNTQTQYAAINTVISNFISGPPTNTDPVPATDGDWRGTIYGCLAGTGSPTAGGKCTTYFIGWYMNGIDTKCAGGFQPTTMCGFTKSADTSNTLCAYTNDQGEYNNYLSVHGCI